MARPRPWPTAPRSIFFDDVASRTTLAKARKAGDIVRVAVGVWTADTSSPPEEVVAANIWAIVARHCPDAVVVDRTAARNGRTDEGFITIATDARTSPLELPGVTVGVRPRVAHATDTPWSSGLTGSSPARAVVDNLTLSRTRNGVPGRTLTRAELQDWLSEKHLAWGPERFGRLRDDALAVAADLHPDRDDEVIALFKEVTGQAPLRAGSGAFTRAVRNGTAWDERRVGLFELAARTLEAVNEPELRAPAVDGELPFFEAYFSNYIEGTKFTVDDAREIVETQTPPARRSADGHDILGTHRCVVDPIGRAQTSADPEALVELLRARHKTIMVGRPDVGPGEFKIADNRVGSIEFVGPDLVHGTLLRGFALLEDLPAGLARAAYAMFVVTEVHPFTDGNGRAARLMMNAEMSSQGLCRIVLPTVLRHEYTSSLRRASVGEGVTTALVKVLTHAWRWTAAMPWTDRPATDAQLLATHALVDSTEAAQSSLQLLLP